MASSCSGACVQCKANFLVIAATEQANIGFAVRLMKAGAVDLIQKPFSAETIRAAIQVLIAIMLGRQSKVIAFELGISVRGSGYASCLRGFELASSRSWHPPMPS
jgi:FixJ family two-component response regulator